MSLSLHTLTRDPKQKSKKKRLGRGNSSGSGNYSGRGMKGQKSRSGGKSNLKYKGLKDRLSSIPMQKGIKPRLAKSASVSVGKLSQLFFDGSVLTPQILKVKKVVKNITRGVKVLSNGEIDKKLVFKKGFKFSEKALEKLTKAGCTIEK